VYSRVARQGSPLRPRRPLRFSKSVMEVTAEDAEDAEENAIVLEQHTTTAI